MRFNGDDDVAKDAWNPRGVEIGYYPNFYIQQCRTRKGIRASFPLNWQVQSAHVMDIRRERSTANVAAMKSLVSGMLDVKST